MTIKEFIKLGGSIVAHWDQTTFYEASSEDVFADNINEVSDMLQIANWKEPIEATDNDFNDGSDYYTIYGPDNIALASDLDEDDANKFIKDLEASDLVKKKITSPNIIKSSND